MESNWIRKGNKINPELTEKEQLLVKIVENKKTVARQMQELMTVYPDAMTDEDYALWAVLRPYLEGNGRYRSR